MPGEPTAEQRAAWNENFALIERIAYRFANLARRRNRRVDVHDLKQSALLRLWKILPRFDASRSKFTTWAGNSIPRLVIDELRNLDSVRSGGTRCGRSKRGRVFINGLTVGTLPSGQEKQIESVADNQRDYEQERADFREMLAKAGLSNPRYLAAAELKFVDGATWIDAFQAVGISKSVAFHAKRCLDVLGRFIERERRER